MYRFKGEAHRSMFLSMVALQLRCNLLRRFGGIRQEECNILRSAPARRLIRDWAAYITDRLPANVASQSAFIAKESLRVPEAVIRTPDIKALLNQDASLKWLVGRIDQDQAQALVPKPYFPSVLRYRLPQFPFYPQEIDKARHLYGLLKFPFYSLTADIHASPSESFKGLEEPVMPNEATVEGNHSIASDCIYHDGGTLGTVNYIYMPSELETGLAGEVL